MPCGFGWAGAAFTRSCWDGVPSSLRVPSSASRGDRWLSPALPCLSLHPEESRAQVSTDRGIPPDGLRELCRV